MTEDTDELVRQFREKEVPAVNYKHAADGVAPIAIKLGAFLTHPVVRKALCKREEPLRFHRIMDMQTTPDVILAEGQLAIDMANVLVGMITFRMARAAFSRHRVSETKWQAFFLDIEAFHVFTTKAHSEMPSELRNCRLSLTLADQYFAQVCGEALGTIIGNVGTLIAFRVSPLDAPALALQVDGTIPKDLTTVHKYKVMVRLTVKGERTGAFAAPSRSIFEMGRMPRFFICQNKVFLFTRQRRRRLKSLSKAVICAILG